MRIRICANSFALLLAAGLVLAAGPALAQLIPLFGAPAPAPAPVPDFKTRLAQYTRARQAYEKEATAYWSAITEKRRARIAKRRANMPTELDDYVLTQPPVYRGPPRPVDPSAPDRGPPEPKKPYIPVIADFLKAAAEQYGFVPDRPESELAFKRAYVKVAAAAGLTREQVVRIYAFETGGNGTYDAQAGLEYQKPGARAVSPAIGYNQLLSTNSVGLLAEYGDQFAAALQQKADGLSGEPKKAMERKIAAFRRMIAFSRTVPNVWSEHDNLAKNTQGGIGIHAAILDRDIGPLLQTRKLVDSVAYARNNGYDAPLTAAELEMMNFTGDGNGLDMVMMPQALRERVPTANFFQRQGYERNPIARRTGVVSALFASIDTQMDHGSQLQGARDLAASF